jgi:Prenyltransferase and squalene oxidase repeat
VQPPADTDLVSTVCLPFLQAAQNHDGGWGFHPGFSSRVEATCWALLALIGLESSNERQQEGFRFLRSTQLPDGSWPSSAEQNVGCWATSLATWALLRDAQSQTAVSAGLRWICEDWPRGTNFLARVMRALRRGNQVNSQDDTLRGWGWTPNTASWVEPTAFALITLDQAPKELLPGGATRRLQYARALLYDRMCPGGGWNCGNPMVYGVPGDPLVEPTAWALLALRDEPNRRENVMSLEWLEKNVSGMLGAGSLALGKICLETFGKRWPANAPDLKQLYARSEFLGNVPVMAWTCLALNARSAWLGAAERQSDA